MQINHGRRKPPRGDDTLLNIRVHEKFKNEERKKNNYKRWKA